MADAMRLDGIHHVTCITADAQRNVDFYAGTLGLRLVKKTVNQDDPTVYHLFYADEEGTPGSDITFFEYPGARRGQAGAGMIHTVAWRVASEAALGFWEERLASEGVPPARAGATLRFEDFEGLAHELRVADVPDRPLVAAHPEIPAEVALQGFDGVRAFADEPERSRSPSRCVSIARSSSRLAQKSSASGPPTRHATVWIIPSPARPGGDPGYSKKVRSLPASPPSSAKKR